MSIINEVERLTLDLFQLDYYNEAEYTDEVADACMDKAADAIEKWGLDTIYESWYRYLTNQCTTPKQVCSFANLFFNYNGTEHPVPDVFKFLGYFYCRLNLKPFDYDEYNASVIMDGISVELLNRSGLRNDLCVGDYVPETDPEIIAAVEKWRAGEYS